MNIQPSFSLILALILAITLGILYDHLVTRLNRTGKTEGYTALLVVGGVILTLALAAPFITFQDGLTLTAFFIATGTPMILGDIVRYIKKREKGRRLME